MSSANEVEKQVVTNLGSLHAHMLDKKNYNLSHFVNAIKTFRPELILTETRRGFPGPGGTCDDRTLY